MIEGAFVGQTQRGQFQPRFRRWSATRRLPGNYHSAAVVADRRRQVPLLMLAAAAQGGETQDRSIRFRIELGGTTQFDELLTGKTLSVVVSSAAWQDFAQLKVESSAALRAGGRRVLQPRTHPMAGAEVRPKSLPDCTVYAEPAGTVGQ